MRVTRRLPLFMVLLTVATAVTTGCMSRGGGGGERGEAERSVRDGVERLMSALHRCDLEGFLAEFHSDADFHNPIGIVLRGRSEIGALHEMLFSPQPPPGFPSFVGTSSTGSIQSLRVLGGDVVVVDWQGTQRGARVGAEEWPERHGANTTVWTYEHGRWGVAAWRDKDFPSGYQRPPGF
ncbi:nuclear transport factor 2 family protein [Nocardia sp. NPDC050193]